MKRVDRFYDKLLPELEKLGIEDTPEIRMKALLMAIDQLQEMGPFSLTRRVFTKPFMKEVNRLHMKIRTE